MKRILLSVVAFAVLALGGLMTNSAQAQGPYGYGCRPGYGGGYGGYGGYAANYGGYPPYNVYSQRYMVPYGAGYSGGWQPYQGFYRSGPRPQVGLYFGF
jgi:hypothetical protein